MSKPLFTEEEIERIDAVIDDMTGYQLTRFIQLEMNHPDLTYEQLLNWVRNHSDFNRRLRKTLLTKAQEEIVEQNIDGMTTRGLRYFFEDQFGIVISDRRMRGWLGHRPHLKKRMDVGYFSKDRLSVGKCRIHPLGAVSFKSDGPYVKLRDCYSGGDHQKNHEKLSKMVWENAHGYTDKNICHLDGDVNNCLLENLFPISQAAQAMIAKKKLWIYDDPELMIARILATELEIAANKRSKGKLK